MKLKKVFRKWLPFVVVTTAFCGLAYATVQQALRQGANDPQIQMAEDTASALNGGSAIDSVLLQQRIDFEKSLAPFIVIYDVNGKPVASSGVLDGQMPEFPKGALDASKQSGENVVTWQPKSTVRVAAVVVPYHNGFVMAGRNLRVVEQNELRTEQLAAITWVLTLTSTLIVIIFGEMFLRDKKE